MAGPTIIDIPHTLGRAEAKRRMRGRIGELASRIPGGAAEVASSWPGENRMLVDVTVMGQKVATVLDVEERLVRVSLALPPVLSFLSGAIAGIVRRSGEAMLLEDRTKPGG